MSTLAEDIQAKIAAIEAEAAAKIAPLKAELAAGGSWLHTEEQHIKDMWYSFIARFHPAAAIVPVPVAPTVPPVEAPPAPEGAAVVGPV